MLCTSFGSKCNGPSVPDPVCAFKEPGVEKGNRMFCWERCCKQSGVFSPASAGLKWRRVSYGQSYRVVCNAVGTLLFVGVSTSFSSTGLLASNLSFEMPSSLLG